MCSGSMEPSFKRGDILFLNMGDSPFRVGEIVVFKIEGREIPIVHRVIRVHEKYYPFVCGIITIESQHSCLIAIPQSVRRCGRETPCSQHDRHVKNAPAQLHAPATHDRMLMTCRVCGAARTRTRTHTHTGKMVQ